MMTEATALENKAATGSGEKDASAKTLPRRSLRLRITEALKHLLKFSEVVRLVREDWVTHNRDCTLPGFRAMAVYRFGAWQRDIRPRLLRWPLSCLYHFLYYYIRNHYGIELYCSTKVGRRFLIGHQGGITIHKQARIGDDCLIRQNTTIGTVSIERTWEAPTLGDRVQLGCGVAILGPVTIGDDTRIGANAVVMTNIPAGSTVVVAPPRIINMKPKKSASRGDSTSTEVS